MKTCKVESCHNNVWGGGYCRYHQSMRTDRKISTLSKAIRKPTGEAAMFKDIEAKYREISPYKPLLCAVSNDTITWYLENQWNSCFAHVIPKGKYPLFRLYMDNVVLMNPRVHSLYDMNPVGFAELYPNSWIYLLRTTMLNQYNIIESSFRLSDIKGMNHHQVTELIRNTLIAYDKSTGV